MHQNEKKRTGRAEEVDDDAPEEFGQDNEDIARLRELHEQMAEEAERDRKLEKKRNKKRRARSHEMKSQSNDDEEIDLDVLEAVKALDDGKEEDEYDMIEGDDGENASDGGLIPFRIDKNRSTSRKIGHLEITTLKQINDPTASFQVSTASLAFAQSLQTNRPRISYSLFASQKKLGPARSFGKKRKLKR
jgi:hypothetical protein